MNRPLVVIRSVSQWIKIRTRELSTCLDAYTGRWRHLLLLHIFCHQPAIDRLPHLGVMHSRQCGMIFQFPHVPTGIGRNVECNPQDFRNLKPKARNSSSRLRLYIRFPLPLHTFPFHPCIPIREMFFLSLMLLCRKHQQCAACAYNVT